MKIKGLDFLRGIAVVLVLFRHGEYDMILAHIGWVGVDLFFVLSGFLVSGIIFREYLSTKNLDVKRFLIRRGFKIYPSFYFFILVSLVAKYFQPGEFYSLKEILIEVFYLQSYGDSMWMHTWSLAVEEQFYFALAIFSYIIIKTRYIERRGFMLSALIVLLVMSFVLRFYSSYPFRESSHYYFTQTHLRMDGILIGVLISYLIHFVNVHQIVEAHRYFFLIVGILFVSPVFFFTGGSFFMNTIGLTVINLGFGLIVLFFVNQSNSSNSNLNFLNVFYSPICFLGVHSYSIYLWHLTSDNLVRLVFDQNIFLLSFLGAIVIGVIFSFVIERPFLRIRDRLYPAATPLGYKA